MTHGVVTAVGETWWPATLKRRFVHVQSHVSRSATLLQSCTSRGILVAAHALYVSVCTCCCHRVHRQCYRAQAHTALTLLRAQPCRTTYAQSQEADVVSAATAHTPCWRLSGHDHLQRRYHALQTSLAASHVPDSPLCDWAAHSVWHN